MAEEIHTGGLKKFVRRKEKINLEPELERKIGEAYEKAGIRKKRDRIIKIAVVMSEK